MNTENSRFLDDGTQMGHFLQRYTVVCPSCGGAAQVAVKEKGSSVLFAPRRLTCACCAFSKEWAEQSVSYSMSEAALDWYFHLPFYFQKPCAGHTLWVANQEHLTFLRSYVAAKHRTRHRDANGWNNNSLASRLPKWIAASKNRTAILSALDDLEDKMKRSPSTKSRNNPLSSRSNKDENPYF